MQAMNQLPGSIIPDASIFVGGVRSSHDERKDVFVGVHAMCTMIVEKAQIDGCGKGPKDWFTLKEVNVSYDHPLHAPLEHALNIDFVNEAEGLGARVAVELSAESARKLVTTILAALERAKAEGHLESVRT